MKRISFMLLPAIWRAGLVFALFLTVNGFSQGKEIEPATIPNIQSMQPSLTTAIAQQKPSIKTIFAFKDELTLTDKQIEDLKSILSNLQSFLVEKNKELEARRLELGDMITKRDDLKTIRKKIEDIAKVQVEISYTDLETARKIEETLTPPQWDKWRAIQKAFQIKVQAEPQPNE